MTDTQITIRGINEHIRKSKQVVAGIKRKLTLSNPEYVTIVKISKYHETMVRFHSTSVMLLEAGANDKPKSLLLLLTKKRMEYMQLSLEILPDLVAAGVIEEQAYLTACADFKNDYDLLHADLDRLED